ncbi:HAD family hydrolase [Streptomyces sp. NPDC058463]|uniref:HAD family hydrolase n=1 Tax=Streptomyces sp. NPDC058463 TaxID=3346510 RepID=UPI00364BFA90
MSGSDQRAHRRVSEWVALHYPFRSFPSMPAKLFVSFAAGQVPIVLTAGPDALWAAPLRKIYVQHPVLDEDALALIATRAAGHLVGVAKAGPGEIELLPLGLDKATGLAYVARRLGLTGADTVAFGDMPNDLPMLDWAAHGVAMAGAHPELRAAADEMAPGNDEDGVAVVLERLFA